jgi:protein-tyrosine phosphatase
MESRPSFKSAGMSGKFRILFVCMGNICRSPAAHGVMQHIVEREGLSGRVEIDSAGTGGWHAGDLPDARMRRHAAHRGYTLDSRARQVKAADFQDFDLILVMDRNNLRDIEAFARKSSDMSKVRLFCDFVKTRTETEVPDPYYGGAEGFETVLDLVEDGCEGILESIPR